MEDPPLTDEQIATQAALIEQDHRFFRVVWNIVVARRDWPSRDPRRRAAWTALIWNLLSPGSIALGGGAIVGLLTMILLSQQNRIIAEQTTRLDEQNRLISLQNNRIDLQNQLNESQRRAALIFELTSIMEALSEERRVWFESLEDEEQEIVRKIDELVTQRGRMLNNTSFDFSAHENETESLLEKAPVFSPSRTVVGRAVALSLSLRPYRFLDQSVPVDLNSSLSDFTSSDNKVELIDRPLSPERAQLLITLLNSGVDLEHFINAGVMFSQADLRNANLSDLDISRVRLDGADLRSANCVRLRLEGAAFRGADLRGARLDATVWRQAILPSPEMLEGASLRGANFDGALTDDEDWLNKLSNVINPESGFETEDWQVVKPNPRWQAPLGSGFPRFYNVIRPASTVGEVNGGDG